MRVELHPEADAEFAAQVECYDDRQPGLGERFYREVIRTLEWIEGNPTLARMRRNYRRVNLKIFPCYVAYVTQNDLVWVLAVAHSHRKPGYWMARMKGG